MIDREKVIRGLEWVIDLFSNYERHAMGDEEMQSLNDAIVLLKAQDNTICTKERCPVNANSISDDCNVRTCPWRTEAVVPKVSMSGLWYECPVCHRHLTKHEDHYCSGCGKRVRWDG